MSFIHTLNAYMRPIHFSSVLDNTLFVLFVIVAMSFEVCELRNDGVRLSWNFWPSSSSDAKKLDIEIGCLTPLL